jgi:hypothetical protein
MEHEEVGTNELCFGPASERRANGTKKGSGGGAFIPDPCSASINCSGNLRDLKVKDARPKHSGFKAYEPGYIHIDVKYLPQMEDQTSRRYLFVAIDRATRWVFTLLFAPYEVSVRSSRSDGCMECLLDVHH